MPTLTVENNTVPCYTCHQPIQQREAQPIRLMVPTGRYRDGVQVLNADKVVYECRECISRELEAEFQSGLS